MSTAIEGEGSDVLARICDETRAEVENRKAAVPLETMPPVAVPMIEPPTVTLLMFFAEWTSPESVPLPPVMVPPIVTFPMFSELRMRPL